MTSLHVNMRNVPHFMSLNTSVKILFFLIYFKCFHTFFADSFVIVSYITLNVLWIAEYFYSVVLRLLHMTESHTFYQENNNLMLIHSFNTDLVSNHVRNVVRYNNLRCDIWASRKYLYYKYMLQLWMCLKLYVSGSIHCVANSFRNILNVQYQTSVCSNEIYGSHSQFGDIFKTKSCTLYIFHLAEP